MMLPLPHITLSREGGRGRDSGRVEFGAKALIPSGIIKFSRAVTENSGGWTDDRTGSQQYIAPRIQVQIQTLQECGHREGRA